MSSTLTSSKARSQDANCPVLELSDVAMAFGAGGPEAEVIRRVHLNIARRSFVTLFGKSGCGKSTLLNIAAGLLKPTHGTVRFDGQPLNSVNQAVGYMTQEDTLLPWRSVRKNIELPLRLRGYNRADMRERVDNYLDLLNLSHAAHRFPGQLSGGMRRRALVARSLIYEPTVLLMDEPFAAIDSSLREDLHAELRRAVEELDQTVLFVTHDIPEAVLLSDRILVFGAAAGSVTELKKEMTMPFGSSRDLSAIRKSEEFSELQRELRLELDRANGE
jgi:NitT/TauT family transport system ATP-binding protein